MAYAFVQDVAASWQQYELIAAATVEPVPDGLILHVAGPTDEGFRIIDVWRTKTRGTVSRPSGSHPRLQLSAALPAPNRPSATFKRTTSCSVRRGSTLGHASQRKERQDA